MAKVVIRMVPLKEFFHTLWYRVPRNMWDISHKHLRKDNEENESWILPGEDD